MNALQTRSIVGKYLSELDASERTRETYTKALRQFHSFLLEVYPETDAPELLATRADIIAYKKHLATDKKASTVNAYLTAVRSFYAYTQAAGIKQDITTGVHGVRATPTQAKDALTKEQAQALLKPQTDTLEGLRNTAILQLMTTRGLRTIEISRANIGDIHTIGGRAVLDVQGKGHAEKDNFVVLSPELLASINAYLSARGCTDLDAPLFTSTSNRNKDGRMTTRSLSRIAKANLESIGVNSPRITAHSLRHTAVTLALIGGATPQEVQQMARHASLNTTMIYAHNLERLEANAETALDKYLGITA